MITRAVTLYLTRHRIRPEPQKVREQVKLTVSFPILLSGISLCLLNMVRYGVISWIPTYLYQQHDMVIEKVGLTVFLIPLAGVVGTLLYNGLKLQKDVSTLFYLVLLGVTFLLLPNAGGTWMVTLLVLGGFLLYGPHVFLVATMPSRFHEQSVVAAATGFIDGWGYVGSAAIGMLVPFMLDVTGNWNTVFYFWSAVAFVIAVVVFVVYVRVFRNGRTQEGAVAYD